MTGLDHNIVVHVEDRGQPHSLDGDHLVTSAAPKISVALQSVPDAETEHHQHVASRDHGQDDNSNFSVKDLDQDCSYKIHKFTHLTHLILLESLPVKTKTS